MGVSTCGSVSTTGCSELIGSHVGSSSDGFTGTALVAGHHSTDAWLKTRHGGGRGAGSNGGPFTDGLDCRCSAVLTCLLKTCIGSAGHSLTTTRLITGHPFGTTGSGATDDLIAVGDAEADLRSFRIRSATAEGIDLFGTDVLITGDAMTGSKLIAGHLGRSTHQSSSHAGA